HDNVRSLSYAKIMQSHAVTTAPNLPYAPWQTRPPSCRVGTAHREYHLYSPTVKPGLLRHTLPPDCHWHAARAVESLLTIKLRIKRNRRRLKVDLFHKGRCLRRAMLAIHPRILPFHAQRPLISDVVQRDNDLFELDISVPQRPEIPKSPRICEGRVAAE